MAKTPCKNLTVRLDPETREKLELVSEREVRPMANQIVVFIRQGIEKYLSDNGLCFYPTLIPGDDGDMTEGGLTLQERRDF